MHRAALPRLVHQRQVVAVVDPVAPDQQWARSGASPSEFGIRLCHPLALFGPPFLVGATQLPVARRRQGLDRQTALEYQMTADGADGDGLTVHERLAPPVG
jgi:hypothetical protein